MGRVEGRSGGSWRVVQHGGGQKTSSADRGWDGAAGGVESPFAWRTLEEEAPAVDADRADEKLSALDAGFLFLEKPNQSFQIGCLAILDSSPGFEELLRTLEERLAAFPRFRQIPVRARLDLGWPVWRDDPDYDIRRHVRHVAVPRPGDRQKLSHLLESLATAALPGDRPRWEMHLIEGIEHGRAALLAKVHHSMNDGVSGFHVLETVTDVVTGAVESAREIAPEKPAGGPLETPGVSRKDSRRTDFWNSDRGLVGLVSDAMADPRGMATRGIRDFAEAAETIATFLDEPPAPMPWNGLLGQGRHFAWRSYPIDEFTSFKVAVDGTLNDAVVAIMSGALRTYALQNGHSPHQGAVRCIVPANVRPKGEEGRLGNHVTAMFPRLPVDLEDPIDRLQKVRDEMRSLKDRKQGRATSMVVAAAGLLPSFTGGPLISAVSDMTVVNTLCTNVPGPKQTLQLCGRKITEIHAIAPLFLDVGLAFAASTYADRISLCVVADPKLVPDVEAVGNALDAAVYETRSALWKKSEALSAASRIARGPTVADLMSRNVATVGVDDSLQSAHEMMRQRRLSHLPVVDRKDRLIGVLTQRDLLFAAPQAPAKVDAEDRARMLGRFAVGRAIDSKLTTARPEEPVLEAGKRMVRNQLDFLPVVDDEGQLLGLVTEDHIVRWTTRSQDGS